MLVVTSSSSCFFLVMLAFIHGWLNVDTFFFCCFIMEKLSLLRVREVYTYEPLWSSVYAWVISEASQKHVFFYCLPLIIYCFTFLISSSLQMKVSVTILSWRERKQQFCSLSFSLFVFSSLSILAEAKVLCFLKLCTRRSLLNPKIYVSVPLCVLMHVSLSYVNYLTSLVQFFGSPCGLMHCLEHVFGIHTHTHTRIHTERWREVLRL